MAHARALLTAINTAAEPGPNRPDQQPAPLAAHALQAQGFFNNDQVVADDQQQLARLQEIGNGPEQAIVG